VDEPAPTETKIPRRDSAEDFIVIPPYAREWELAAFPLSARLKHSLAHRGCQRLGEFHGLRHTDLLRWRNIGVAILRKWLVFIHSVQQGDWGVGPKPSLAAWPPGREI
jgi:hypothetical protein